MQIRLEQPEDYPAIAQVHTSAFGRSNEADLVECLRHSGDFVPELALVAEVADEIAGHILFTQARLEGEQSHQVLTLAPLAVKPSHQHQGIGSALVQAGLAIAAQRQERVIIVLGHPTYYSRFGFEPAIRYGIHAPFEVPQEAFMVWRSPNYAPTCQGTVVYPNCFNSV